MKKLATIYWVVILGCTILPQCKAWYSGYTNDRIKNKLTYLARDLCTDAMSKIKSVQYFKVEYNHDPSFHLAFMMYKIRTKYGKMKKFYDFVTHNMGTQDERVFIRTMGKIHYLVFQLEHDIRMIEDWEEAGANLDDIYRRAEMSGSYGANDITEIVTGQPSSEITPKEIDKINSKKKVLWSAHSNPLNYEKSKKLNRELQNKFNNDFEQMY